MARVVLDDRGRRQRIPPPDKAYGIARLDRRTALLEAARAELAGVSAGLWPRTLGALALGLVMGLFLYRQALHALGSLDRLGAATLAVIAGSAAALGYFKLSKPILDLYRVAELFRDACMCMVCGYDLSAATPAADGCIVCPECGAAWHVLRLTPLLPPQTASAPAASPPSAPTPPPAAPPSPHPEPSTLTPPQAQAPPPRSPLPPDPPASGASPP